jgi:multicomponent Na+:H+ antiporter subunit C
MTNVFLDRYIYVFVLILLAVGLYGAIAMRDLFKKVIGLVIFQTAIFFFFIKGSVSAGGTVPIIDPERGNDPAAYMNPLPHLLILTAIVVGVAVIGVALALLVGLHRTHGTLDEDEIIDRLPER